ncbi:helix-turn-helix domain-containing protein [Alicyclobacillus tolerans]|uniref:helix-turn-helix domain-containing protein n=1 Tax=Alicyclobacillus tolerans TaxID=90970 RepID=UPI003B7CDF0E
MKATNRIAQLRKERGMTQAQLAKLAGVSTSAIAMYETNRRQPDEQILQQLSSALQVSPEELNNSKTNNQTETRLPHQEKTQTVKAAPIAAAQAGTTTLTLSREEARMILFTRMNPQAMEFLQAYINADAQKRAQVEKAWRLIHEFQRQ